MPLYYVSFLYYVLAVVGNPWVPIVLRNTLCLLHGNFFMYCSTSISLTVADREHS